MPAYHHKMKRNGQSTPYPHRDGRGPRRNKHLRTDRDGDVSMGAAPTIRNNNRVNKPLPRSRPHSSDREQPSQRRDPFKAPEVQRETLRRINAHIASNNTSSSSRRNTNNNSNRGDERAMRDTPNITSSSQPQASSEHAPRGPRANQPLINFHITGWTNSNASSNADGGVSSLIGWIERKATDQKVKHNRSKGFNQGPPIKVRSHTVNNDVLTIQVGKSDFKPINKLNGYQWAGAIVTIQSDAALQGKDEDMAMSVSDSDHEPTAQAGQAIEAPPPAQAQAQTQAQPSYDDNFNTEEERRAAMLQEVMRQTGMTQEYALFCLDAGEWDWVKAGLLFVEKRETLPAEAFTANEVV